MSLVEDAAAELYGGDLDAFTDRRRELAAAARQQGDADAAKEIAALRKPTRSAWTLNALAGAAADQLGQLDDLAAELRDAEQRLDGAAMRELSKRRRELVDDLARRAFKATRQTGPSTAIREEVNATLLAAIADPDVAEQLTTGRLVRAAQWDGFGSGSAPTTRPNLRAVPSPKAEPTPREPTAIERAKRERVAAAEKEVTAARRVVVKAETEAAKHQQRLDALEEQLAAIRRQLTETGHQVRDAKAELRRAEQKLDRARG
jgi:septal ring factor EnvC (AmiA/AmiB activator)